ncbi:MAG TPA: hypothetical protein VFF79_05555 [Conexibacter sp.]|nr:hypothetical protein [Conexibacter sp.]
MVLKRRIGEIGEDGLGEFARRQMDAARSDPRLGRERGAVLADFWDAVEEAERVRMLGILGMHELAAVLDREEQRLGVSRDQPDLSPDTAARLQAFWERSEMARLELTNGNPHLNAQALISMNSALDALVEELAPAVRDVRRRRLAEAMLSDVKARVPAFAELADEVRETIEGVVEDFIDDRLPKAERLRESGARRYERVLEGAGLAAPRDRPIPPDLDCALTELGALRDVLIHRGGRVDARALRQAPSLMYGDGQMVRMSDADFRTYSAAVRCYAAEVQYRLIRGWIELPDEDAPDLARWRDYRRLGA